MIKLVKFVLQFFDNYQSKKVLSFIDKSFKNNQNIDIFFDIGGHKGETCIQFFKKFNVKQAHVFEPEPDTFKILEKNLKNKFKNVQKILNNVALGDNNANININSSIESSSSTIHDLDENTDYFIKKKNY